MSIVLLFTKTFSVVFYAVYIYCCVSDMPDGFIARKTKNESRVGARLDSVSDLVFIIVAMIKILPFLNLTNGIIIWVVFIALIKIFNMFYSYFSCKEIVFSYIVLNKLTGFILFISPFMVVNTNLIMFEVIICGIATFAAV